MASGLAELLLRARIVPVAVFSDVQSALTTAAILLEESIPLIEVTLRTEAAFDCIDAVSGKFDRLLVGAGSVLSRESLKRAVEAGARFGVAPCFDPELLAYAAEIEVPFIPGVATPSELGGALRAGARLVKIFPAADLGGAAYINAITSPFKMYDFSLIPTGGISDKNIKEYLAAKHVVACGASFIVDSALIERGDYDAIRERIARVRELISI